jgi:hypothetical protein
VTATVPRQATARLGHVYSYDVCIGGVVVEHAYIGRARDVERRDRQHRGLAPQRDGVVREQPWADQIVRLRVLRTWVCTDAELNGLERAEIRTRFPVLNHEHNLDNPNRIPIPVQHEQRKLRDQSWVIPDWSRPRRPVQPANRSPLAALWRWLSATLPFRVFVSWLLLALAVCVAVAWGSHAVGHRLPVTWALGVGAVASAALHIWQWKRIRRLLRRL